jgi:tRNA(His) 5'-end guanylyltransferase
MKEPSQIGQRIKRNYEDITRTYLPRRTYTIIRVDGRAFHTFTRGIVEPFDHTFMDVLDRVAKEMCNEIQGARFAYLQSDEISILATDFRTHETDAWFGGELRKICSVSASIATAWFNRYWEVVTPGARTRPPAFFDSRAFTVPSRTEVMNYFIWRQQDCSRNSVQMVAQHHYSQRQLQGKNSDQLQELIHLKGDNWNAYPVSTRRGRIVSPETETAEITYTHKGTGEEHSQEVERAVWVTHEQPPIFTQDREYLEGLVPEPP